MIQHDLRAILALVSAIIPLITLPRIPSLSLAPPSWTPVDGPLPFSVLDTFATFLATFLDFNFSLQRHWPIVFHTPYRKARDLQVLTSRSNYFLAIWVIGDIGWRGTQSDPGASMLPSSTQTTAALRYAAFHWIIPRNRWYEERFENDGRPNRMRSFWERDLSI